MTQQRPSHPSYVPTREIQRLDMTFTDAGLRSVKSFRRKLINDMGRQVSLAEALDILIKSHPFSTGGR